jgi:hypothetical protein
MTTTTASEFGDIGRENRLLIVADGRVHGFTMGGGDAGRHCELPLDVVVRRWQALQDGHGLGMVMLLMPTDAGIGAEALQQVLVEASLRAGFSFMLSPSPMTTAEAVAAWQDRGPWQKVH